MSDLPISLGAYKDKVRRVAMAAAITHGWCKEVQQVLAELDIDLPEPTIVATVTVTYELQARIPYDHVPSVQAGAKAFIGQHLHVPSLLISEGQGTLNVEEGTMFDPTKIEITEVRLEGEELHENQF